MRLVFIPMLETWWWRQRFGGVRGLLVNVASLRGWGKAGFGARTTGESPGSASAGLHTSPVVAITSCLEMLKKHGVVGTDTLPPVPTAQGLSYALRIHLPSSAKPSSWFSFFIS